MIGVKMGDEGDPKSCWFERLYTPAHIGAFGPPHHAWPEIDKVRRILDDDCSCGARSIRIGRWISSS
jgi:hypothetical protein